MSALTQLSAFVAMHRPDEQAHAQVWRHVADTIGAWIAATGIEEGRALLRHCKTEARLCDRITVNCALARMSEVDDIHLGAMITPGAIVIPAALTISASLPDERADNLIAAIVAGYEAMIRLGVAIDGPTVLYRGIWPSYFAAPFGVAAVYARLAKLDATQTAHALALSLIMAAPGVGRHTATTTARWLAIGNAAARGLSAALAAEAGFTSDLDLADGEFMRNIYGIAPKVSALRDGLGETAIRQVSFKPWCAARQTMAAVQALKEILSEGVSVDSIDAIDVAVLPPHLKMIDHGVVAGDRFSHLTSVQYQMAVAALRPDTMLELGAPMEPISPLLRSFMARMNVRAEESLLAVAYPKSWPAQVTAVTATGRHERRVVHVPGDPARAMSEIDLKHKFCRLVAPILGESTAEEMYGRCSTMVDRSAAEILRDLEQIYTYS